MHAYFRALLRLFFQQFHYFPEGTVKNTIRRRAIRRAPAFRREGFINKGDDVVIVGTDKPETVHRAASAVKQTGKVIVFEADDRNYERIIDASDEYPHVEIRKQGVWSDRGTVEFKIAPDSNSDDNKIVVEEVEHDNDYRENAYIDTVTLSVDSLDNLLTDEGIQPDYIEIAVNGAELEVLRGASDVLERSKPRLWVKGHARQVDTKEPLNKTIVEFLEQKSYNTVISKGGSSTVADIEGWNRRAGDVYGWKP